MYQVNFTELAKKSLKKLPTDYQIKVKEIVQKLSNNPFVLDIKKLHHTYKASHRLRIGSYRIFLDINTKLKEIIIIDIDRRTTQTYR